MAWVWGASGISGAETSRRPVMPRWIKSSTDVLFDPTLSDKAGKDGAPGSVAALLLLRWTVITMVLPTRRTDSMRAPVRVAAISGSGDLKVCGLPLVQTRVMRAPWTRAWTPAAMVSTSGSSGIGIE